MSAHSETPLATPVRAAVDLRRFPWIRPLVAEYASYFGRVSGLFAGNPTSAADWASFEFEVKTPGAFEVELLVGCAPGSGGSLVQVGVGEQKLEFTVEETGGFQDFRPRQIGRITLDRAGRHTLEIRPLKKPGPAVMDVRQVRLAPAK